MAWPDTSFVGQMFAPSTGPVTLNRSSKTTLSSPLASTTTPSSSSNQSNPFSSPVLNNIGNTIDSLGTKAVGGSTLNNTISSTPKSSADVSAALTSPNNLQAPPEAPKEGFINYTPEQMQTIEGMHNSLPPVDWQHVWQVMETPYGNMGDFDMRSPGAMEAYWNQIQGQLNQPGYAEDAWKMLQGQMNGPNPAADYWQSVMNVNAPKGSNYVEQGYKNFFAPENANLDSYYDNAFRQAQERINSSYGSRGMFGSSAALGQISEAGQNLAAEQANREAQYALDRLAEQRGWATAADDLSLRRGQQGLDYMLGKGQLAKSAAEGQDERMRMLMQGALGMDENNLAKMLGAGKLAESAQDARRQRGQDYFNNTMAPFMALYGSTLDQQNKSIEDFMGLLDTITNLNLGNSESAINKASSDSAEGQKQTANALEVIKLLMKD